MSSLDRTTPRRCSSKPCYPNTRPGPASNLNPHLNPHLNPNPAAVTAKSPARRSGRSAGCSCRCGSRAARWSCIPSRLCPRKIGRDRSTEGGRPSPQCRCPALYSPYTQVPLPAITIILLPMSAGLRQRRGPVRAAQHVPAREAAPDPPDPRENPGWDQDSLRRCSMGGTAAAAAALKCAEARGGDCGRGEARGGVRGAQRAGSEGPWLLVEMGRS